MLPKTIRQAMAPPDSPLTGPAAHARRLRPAPRYAPADATCCDARSCAHALIATLDGVDRLVLLGDVLELRHGPLREALAQPAVISWLELGEALGAGREVVIVPGNHDHYLLAALARATGPPRRPAGARARDGGRPGTPASRWRRSRAGSGRRASAPPIRACGCATTCTRRTATTPIATRRCRCSSGSAQGRWPGSCGEPPGGPRAAEDYEAMLAPLYAWIHAIAQHDGPIGRRRSSQGASARAWRALGGQRQAARRCAAARSSRRSRRGRRPEPGGARPAARDISGPELRRGGLRAFGEVLRAARRIGAARDLRPHPSRRAAAGRRAVRVAAPHRRGAAQHRQLGARAGRSSATDPGESPYRAGFAVVARGRRAAGAGRTCSTARQRAQPGVKQTAMAADAVAELELELAARCCARARSARSSPGASTAIAAAVGADRAAPSSTAHTPPASYGPE